MRFAALFVFGEHHGTFPSCRTWLESGVLRDRLALEVDWPLQLDQRLDQRFRPQRVADAQPVIRMSFETEPTMMTCSFCASALAIEYGCAVRK